MKTAIYILETCDEGSFGELYDYNALPTPVKEAVDCALASACLNFKCDIYEQGLQFLSQYEKNNQVDLKISVGEEIKYLGQVELYHKW